MVYAVLQKDDKVCNIAGTARFRSRYYESWKQFWKNECYKKWPDKCRIAHCLNEATDGAHVTIDGMIGEFIFPMCNKCNNKGSQEWLTANSKTIAVPVNARDTR